ncbi:MAG: FHA domain-containing protein [Acidobacteria bacterium]|nr:FHA domain-containing protein [Acidobacteriota bacterium]MDW7984212.1 FHA domain-containing protein [Acidobacteriota bacterium]
MAIQLTVRLPDGQTQTLTVAKETAFIGRREGNDVILPFPFVSSRHCRVFRHGTRLLVEDLGSTNGTLVNGESLAPQTPHALRPGDVIQIGTVEVRAQWFEEAAVVETSTPTLYEAVPAEVPPRTPARPPNPPTTSASAPDAPATMWEIQTGMYRSAVVQVDDHRVGTATANAPIAPRPAFQGGVGAARPAPPRQAEPSVDTFQVWSLFFQAIGLVTLFGAIILLIIVLLS